MMDLRATNKGAEPAAGTPGLSPPALRGGGRGRGARKGDRSGEESGGRGGSVAAQVCVTACCKPL